jgi:citrate synthase
VDKVDQYQSIDYGRLLTAAEAAERLGIRRSSLYTYVSRGLIQSVALAGSRARLYRQAEVDSLARRRGEAVASPTLGTQSIEGAVGVVDSALGEALDAGPMYRGHLATKLFDTSFEAVAELLWGGELRNDLPEWRARGLGLLPMEGSALVPPGLRPVQTLSLVVGALGSRDPDRFGASPTSERYIARRLLLRMAAMVGLGKDPARCGPALKTGAVAPTLTMALGLLPEPSKVRAVELALIASADGPLDRSSWAARSAASAGADLYACLSSALAVFAAPAQAGLFEQVEALAAEAAELGPAEAIQARGRRGAGLPGFGLAPWPQADPRVPALLDSAAEHAVGSVPVLALVEAARRIRDKRGLGPSLPVALVAVSLSLGLPPGSAEILFAVGRSAGWIAHVLEQRHQPPVPLPRLRHPVTLHRRAGAPQSSGADL